MIKPLESIVDIIKSINSKSCPESINLHCHTTCSDGSLDPLELYNQACRYKLSHLAITDHHSINAYSLIKRNLIKNKTINNTTKLWSGIEISCLLKGCLVHIIGLDFILDSQYLLPYIQGSAVTGIHLQAKNVVQAIAKAKGISILAHPARYRLDYSTLIKEAYDIGINGVEVWYDYELSSLWKPSDLICQSIHDLCGKYNLMETCGTDTHGYSLFGR